MTPIEGVEDISRRANHWYDPNVVDALREIHGLKPLEVTNRPEVPRRITTLRVLRSNPGFSSLITSIGISSIGDPLTQVATLVSIYLATSDARFVALAFIVQALGTILMTAVLGGLADRLPRRALVVGLELVRGGILLATPFLIANRAHWWFLFPILLVLSSINAIVQPAKQAAIPSLVPAGQIGKANAIVAAVTMLAGAVGFGVAGVVLGLFPKATSALFVADAITFILAAGIVFGIPSLGGGTSAAPVVGGLKRSWRILSARPHLVIGTLAAFLIPISYPALLALAYQVWQQGGQMYSVLELVSSVGIFAGSLVVSRFGAIGTMRTVGAGLLLSGAFSLAIYLSPTIGVVLVALFLASMGNPIYAVANQTALIETADATSRGTVMATRFGLVQTASVVGAAVGGIITRQFSPTMAYGVLGVGLLVLALYALAAGRSTTNPLHGRAYEEATLQAKT
jgi:MFS family permease